MNDLTPEEELAYESQGDRPESAEEAPKDHLGRPTVMTDAVLAKLREAFLMGCTDREACLYADIAAKTLYNYQESHPEYVQQKEEWKESPMLKARTTIHKDLDKPDTAKWYAERKRKDEFAPKTEVEIEGGFFKAKKLEVEIVDPVSTEPEAPSEPENPPVEETAPSIDAA